MIGTILIKALSSVIFFNVFTLQSIHNVSILSNKEKAFAIATKHLEKSRVNLLYTLFNFPTILPIYTLYLV